MAYSLLRNKLQTTVKLIFLSVRSGLWRTVLKPNSWTYKFVDVFSGHNLESSQTWCFRVGTLFTLQFSLKPILLKGGGGMGGWGGVRKQGDCEKQGGSLKTFVPHVQEFGLCIVARSQHRENSDCEEPLLLFKSYTPDYGIAFIYRCILLIGGTLFHWLVYSLNLWGRLFNAHC
jgi:hypothetical protein